MAQGLGLRYVSDSPALFKHIATSFLMKDSSFELIIATCLSDKQRLEADKSHIETNRLCHRGFFHVTKLRVPILQRDYLNVP